MNKVYFFSLCLLFFVTTINAQITFTIINVANSPSITCYNPTLNCIASSNYSAAVQYTWNNGTSVLSGSNVVISQPGNYTVSAASAAATGSQVLTLGVNTIVPVTASGSTFMVTSAQPVTLTVVSPTINIVQYVYSPFGSTFTANSYSCVYMPGGTGVHTYCVQDLVNGCATCTGPGGPYVPGSPATATSILKQADRVFDFTIYPNPSQSLFKCNANQDIFSVELFSQTGGLLNTENPESNEFLIDLSEFSEGVYIIRLTDQKNNCAFKRLLKQ